MLAFWAINLPHLLFHRMSIARSCSVSTGHANKTPEEPPYETLTYANGPGFNTHTALNLSNCAKGLWREIPQEERRQARWDSAIVVVVVIIIIIIIITATGGWRTPHSAGWGCEFVISSR